MYDIIEKVTLQIFLYNEYLNSNAVAFVKTSAA
jgi:hypothetical protein